MVDFQSRDRSRGLGDDDDDEDDPPDESDAGDESDAEEAVAKSSAEDSTGDDSAAEAEHADDGHDHDNHHAHDEDHGSHDHHAHDIQSVSAAVLTVSSSRTLADDPAGDAIVEGLNDAGHEVATRELVNDGYDNVQRSVDALVDRSDVDIVVTTGGTGVTPDDVTVEATRQLFDKPLPGFGELFRSLSFDEIGTRIVGTRAVAGVADGVPVFCLPGSENAARLGTEEIVVEEAGHLAGLARRDDDEE